MMYFIALLQATKNGNCRFYRWFTDEHFLEASLKGCVFLNVLSVFIERCGTNTMQFASSECRLKHIARIHCTFCFTSADHGMYLINKHNGAACIGCDIFENRLQTFLKFTTILCPGKQSSQIQHKHPLVFQGFGDFARVNSLGQTFNNRCLTNAWLTDQDWIIFCPTLQNLYRTTYFVVSANHRIEFALPCTLRKIDAVFFKCLALTLCIG